MAAAHTEAADKEGSPADSRAEQTWRRFVAEEEAAVGWDRPIDRRYRKAADPQNNSEPMEGWTDPVAAGRQRVSNRRLDSKFAADPGAGEVARA